MHEIKETDWKVLRHVHPLAVERFCERVLSEVTAVSHDRTQSYHERYRQIFKIIQNRDHEIARIFDNPRRSLALIMLAQMRREGLLTEEGFSSLSTESRGAIEMMLGTW